MIDRSEGTGLTVAVAGHVALFGLLSVGFLATPNPDKLKNTPIEVSLADTVALESAAPVPSNEAPAAKLSPVEAPVEPDSAPPVPPSPPEPAPAKPEPSPPKPAPAPAAKPQPKPPTKPAPPAAPSTKPASKPATAAPASKPAPRRPTAPTGRLDGILSGISDRPSPSKTTAQPGATMSAQAATNIGSAIARQVQPCADRQVTPGPGAERIRAVVNLRINRDGSLAGPPRIVGHDGVDDGNERYVTRVDDAVRAIFAGCAPLRGLPAELYDVPNGWKSFTLRYRLKS